MARKPKITFSKMENQPTLGTGQITIYVNGEPYAEIMKESDLTADALHLEHMGEEIRERHGERLFRPSEFTIETYIVGFGEQCAWGEGWSGEREFSVSDYDGARAALSAAKQWVRDEFGRESWFDDD